MDSYVFDGGTAVVTGAASGIGEALAGALAGRNSHLLLVDRDAERLSGVASAISTRHPAVDVGTHVVDLSDAGATERCARSLRSRGAPITLLVNNAGVALGGRFDQIRPEEFEWVMNVNFRAPVILTSGLLPALKAKPGSHLVNVSSVFGLIAPAGQSAYSSSKYALRGFTEVLRHEFAADGMGVTSVHPSGVRTRIVEHARIGAGVPAGEAEAIRSSFARFLTIDPADAAQAILTGVEHRKPRVLIGRDARALDLLARVAPASYGRMLRIVTRVCSGQAL